MRGTRDAHKVELPQEVVLVCIEFASLEDQHAHFGLVVMCCGEYLQNHTKYVVNTHIIAHHITEVHVAYTRNIAVHKRWTLRLFHLFAHCRKSRSAWNKYVHCTTKDLKTKTWLLWRQPPAFEFCMAF